MKEPLRIDTITRSCEKDTIYTLRVRKDSRNEGGAEDWKEDLRR